MPPPPSLSSSRALTSPLETTTAAIATTTMMNDLLRNYANANNTNNNNTASSHSFHYSTPIVVNDVKPHSHLNEMKVNNNNFTSNADYINGKDNILSDRENNTFYEHEIVDYGHSIKNNTTTNSSNNNKYNTLVTLPPSLHTALKHLYHEMSATREENEVLRRNQQEQSALLKRILERQASLEIELTQQTQKREGESFINNDIAQSVQVLTEHMTQLKQRHERTNDKLRKVENELKRDKANREELIKESRAMLSQATKDEETRKATHEAEIQKNEKRIKEMEAQIQSLQQIRCTEQFVKDKLQKHADYCTARIEHVEQKLIQELNNKLPSWSVEQSRKVNEEVDRKCSAMSQSIERISQECKAMLSRSEEATTESYERFATLTREQHKVESEMRAQVRELQHKMETYKQENDASTKEENAKHKRTCAALRSSISDLRQRCECQWNGINKEMQHKIVSAINANEREREAIAHDKLVAINTLKSEYAKDKADLEQFKQTVVTLQHQVNNVVTEMSTHHKLQSDQLKSAKMKKENKKEVEEQENKGQRSETVVPVEKIVEISEKLDKFEQERKSVRNDIAQIHDQLANMKAWHEESVNALQSSYSQLSHEVSDHHASIRRHVAKQVDDVITIMQSTSSKVNALEEQCAHMFKEIEMQHEFYDTITNHSQKCEEREVHERAVLHDMIHDIRCRLESELNEQHVMSIEAKREFVELESRLELVEEKIKNSNNRKSSIDNAQLSCDDLKLLAELAQRISTESNNATSSTQNIEEGKIVVTNTNNNSKNKENTEMEQEVQSLSCMVHSIEERLHKMEYVLSLLEKKNMESNDGVATSNLGKQSSAPIGLTGDTIANDKISSLGIYENNKCNNLEDNTFLSTLLKLQQTQESSANSFHVKLEEMHAQWYSLIRRMAQSETHTQEVQRRQCECESKLNQTLHKCTLLSTQVERNESGLHESSHVVATLASEMTALLERLLETEEHMQGVNEHVHTELEKIQTMVDTVSNAYKENQHQQEAIITTTIHDQLDQVNTVVEQLQISLQQVQQKMEHLEKIAIHTNDVNEEECTNEESKSGKAEESNDDKVSDSNNESITQSVESLQDNLRELQAQIIALQQKYSDVSSLISEYRSNNNNNNHNNNRKNSSDEQWQTKYMDVFELVQFKVNSLEKEQNAVVRQFELLEQDHSALTTHLTEIDRELESITTKNVINNNVNSDRNNLNENCNKDESNKLEFAEIHENKISEIIEECHLLRQKIKLMEHVNCTRSEVEERLQEMEITLTMELAHKADTEEVINKWQELKTNLELTLHTELNALHKELEVSTKDKISISELQQLLQAEVMQELESTNQSGSNSPDSNISDTINNKNKIEQRSNNNIKECVSDNSDMEMENFKETKSAHDDVYDAYDYEKRAKHEYGNHETNLVEVHIDADDDGDHEHTEKFYNRLRFSNENKNNSKEINNDDSDKNNKDRSKDSENVLSHQEQNDVDDV